MDHWQAEQDEGPPVGADPIEAPREEEEPEAAGERRQPMTRPVLVRGVGRRFSGVYYVQSVRTTMEDNRLLQTFVALRNATGQSGRERFGQSAEEVPAT